MKKNVVNYAGVVLGVFAIVIGFVVMNPETYILGRRDALGSLVEFGADFYTEMYHMTYQVGMEVQRAYANVCNAVGWLIVFFGAFDICYFLSKIVQMKQEVEVQESVSAQDELPDL